MGDPAPEELLRAKGLRVTPQRRAILAAFAGGPTEHLSADEVHARAVGTVPELGRGTVYAALAELTELGLLGAVGQPEPVRYETNVAEHQHFRCRICLRLFDIDAPLPHAIQDSAPGFVVERTAVTADGVCRHCGEYQAAVQDGVDRVHVTGPPDAGLRSDVACRELASPLGPLLLAATKAGLIRVAYEEHTDAAALRECARRRRGARVAHRHLARAAEQIDAYCAGAVQPDCPIDWDTLDAALVPTLQAVARTVYGRDTSYTALVDGASVHDRGCAVGANPLALLVPCHRISRGPEVLPLYVGGPERKQLLRSLERAHAV